MSGQIIACAPAQNFVHRAELERDGILLNIRRIAGEAQSEFIASEDIWFHPIHLSIGPNGGIYIADFYREIIEDYSAIPRYLQQQYGLDDGKDHGRVWRLVHNDMPKPQSPNMSKLSNDALTREVVSPRFWRRQTARRLLLERAGHADDRPARITLPANGTTAAINALYTLDGLAQLNDNVLESALGHSEPGVRRHALRLAEDRLNSREKLLNAALRLASDPSPVVRLQLALSLGESDNPRSLQALAGLARRHGEEAWLDGAILSSLGNRAGKMLKIMLSNKTDTLGQARGLIHRLCSAVASRKNPRRVFRCDFSLKRTR
ncbi:MAG: hypothetical protein CM1200mP29_16430 [Verrucomicrobiota bacterium]|nr:MAG: hypothetical protein CM1200mP29_16430 [Verrucomicrobiota bacterium]